MRKSSKKRRENWEKGLEKGMITLLVVASIATTWLSLQMINVEAKTVKFDVEVEPIPEPELPEMDWSNFTSIYEEDLIVVKAEEAKLKAEEAKKRLEDEQDEVWYLAKAIHGEGSVCDNPEKYRIGTVIMNRVESTNYHNTVKGVVSSGGYSCYQDKRWYTEEPTAEEWAIARDIYENGVRVFGPEVIYQAKKCCGICVYESPWHQYGVDA